MINPLLPVELVNAMAAIPGGSGIIELRSTFAFSEEAHATAFVQHLAAVGALQTYGIAAASQAEAETGSSTALRAWTPQRVAQAIAALAPSPDLSAYASISYVAGAIATAVASTYHPKGPKDCSGNPDYPAATVNDTYVVSVAGKIGGPSGKPVEVGDTLICTATAASGNQATVGASWTIVQNNVVFTTQGLAIVQVAANLGSGRTFLTVDNAGAVQLETVDTIKTALGVVNGPVVFEGTGTLTPYIPGEVASISLDINTIFGSLTDGNHLTFTVAGVVNDTFVVEFDQNEDGYVGADNDLVLNSSQMMDADAISGAIATAINSAYGGNIIATGGFDGLLEITTGTIGADQSIGVSLESYGGLMSDSGSDPIPGTYAVRLHDSFGATRKLIIDGVRVTNINSGSQTGGAATKIQLCLHDGASFFPIYEITLSDLNSNPAPFTLDMANFTPASDNWRNAAGMDANIYAIFDVNADADSFQGDAQYEVYARGRSVA